MIIITIIFFTNILIELSFVFHMKIRETASALNSRIKIYQKMKLLLMWCKRWRRKEKNPEDFDDDVKKEKRETDRLKNRLWASSSSWFSSLILMMPWKLRVLITKKKRWLLWLSRDHPWDDHVASAKFSDTDTQSGLKSMSENGIKKTSQRVGVKTQTSLFICSTQSRRSMNGYKNYEWWPSIQSGSCSPVWGKKIPVNL